MTEIMTPSSRRWGEFINALDCAVQINGCHGGESLRLAKAIMGGMGGVNVAQSIEYFRDHGGFCDCEILMNVDR